MIHRYFLPINITGIQPSFKHFPDLYNGGLPY